MAKSFDRLGRSAELIGAVNTVVVRVGDLVGENTDGRGFVEALRRRVDPAGLRVVLLGAGGAARAIAVGRLLSFRVTLARAHSQHGCQAATRVPIRGAIGPAV